MDYHKEIGEKVRKIREKKERTQAEFAEEIGLTSSYWGQLERGQKNFTIDMLHKIAEKNDISIANLLCDENELLQYWESATKDLKMNEKKELTNAFKIHLIALKHILEKNK